MENEAKYVLLMLGAKKSPDPMKESGDSEEEGKRRNRDNCLLLMPL
jgi:hypothetical protein